jgi:hypothetical protein
VLEQIPCRANVTASFQHWCISSKWIIFLVLVDEEIDVLKLLRKLFFVVTINGRFGGKKE